MITKENAWLFGFVFTVLSILYFFALLFAGARVFRIATLAFAIMSTITLAIALYMIYRTEVIKQEFSPGAEKTSAMSWVIYWGAFILLFVAFLFHDHPWVITRFDLIRTRPITFASFSIRIPRGWNFVERGRLLILSRSSAFRREDSTTPSMLERIVMRPNGEVRTYISAGRVFIRGGRFARGVMFTEISIFGAILPGGANPSAQELNDILLAKIRERMPNYQHIRVIRSDVKMLHGYAWAKTTLTHQRTTYIFWQTVANGHNHYMIVFQTDNLPLAEPVFENIMESFSFRR